MGKEMLRCTSPIRNILHFKRLVSWPHEPDECTERTRDKVHIKCWVMSLRPWATGTQGQMGKWAITLIMLIRTLFTECLLYARSHAKCSTYIFLFYPRTGTTTIPISQMRKIKFRDVNSLAHWEMDLRRQCRQTNSGVQRKSCDKDKTSMVCGWADQMRSKASRW